MRAGLARDFTPPQITLIGRDATIASIVDARAPEDTVFYKPFLSMPASVPAAIQALLRADAIEAIRDRVIPAHRALLSFMRQDYIPHARKTLAADALPDGRAYYQSKLVEFTTTDLTPDQIHEIGLSEVANIRSQMLDVMREVHFARDLPAFLTFFGPTSSSTPRRRCNCSRRPPTSPSSSMARRPHTSATCRARVSPSNPCLPTSPPTLRADGAALGSISSTPTTFPPGRFIHCGR